MVNEECHILKMLSCAYVVLFRKCGNIYKYIYKTDLYHLKNHYIMRTNTKYGQGVKLCY